MKTPCRHRRAASPRSRPRCAPGWVDRSHGQMRHPGRSIATRPGRVRCPSRRGTCRHRRAGCALCRVRCARRNPGPQRRRVRCAVGRQASHVRRVRCTERRAPRPERRATRAAGRTGRTGRLVARWSCRLARFPWRIVSGQWARAGNSQPGSDLRVQVPHTDGRRTLGAGCRVKKRRKTSLYCYWRNKSGKVNGPSGSWTPGHPIDR